MFVQKCDFLEVVKLLIEREDLQVNQPMKNGKTPLYVAAKNGHDKVVKLLLEIGDIDVNQVDKNGWTALTWAACFGHFDVAKLLLQREDVNVNQADEDGVTPLYIAADFGNEGLVELLVGHKDIQLTKAKKSGETPLGIALKKIAHPHANYDGIVRIILEQLIKPQDENSTCIVCMDRRAEVVLVPCGHQNMCSPCAHQWDGEQKGCPMDRINISGILPL